VQLPDYSNDPADIAVIGAGAAGLMGAISAGGGADAGQDAAWRGHRPSIIALDGAARLGAKILVAGGGRCNVTHHRVSEGDYAGSSRAAIRKVLLRFDVPRTVAFFASLGVTLKQEDTGKLFPTTDSARTVLDALLRAADDAGVQLVHPWRVARITKHADHFGIERERAPNAPGAPLAPDAAVLRARRVILATGGKSLPKTGSDGAGFEIARALGHTITPHVFPALAPLMVDKGCWTCELSGVATRATIDVRTSTGKRLQSFTNSLLLTHFGLSGPAALDVSRYLTAARIEDPGARVCVHWLPDASREALDQRLQGGAGSVLRVLMQHRLAERLARGLCALAGVEPGVVPRSLSRERRGALLATLTECVLPVTGDRGYLFAEATAGGVPLSEVRLETMESRACPGLYVCGEVLDVDGRIGGFNFQWAWASGYVAGVSAVASLLG
jgi:predicted Rossmann fold flavoprotein